MSELRKAALCLHSLQDDDRAWLMQRLPVEKRDELSGLLDELKSLGIPGDQSWQQLGLNMNTTELQAAPDDEYELDAFTAQAVWAVLSREPASVIAAVLACRHWSWRQEVAGLYEKAQRNTLKLPAQLNDRVKQALVSALLSRLREQETGSHALVHSPHNNGAAPGVFKRMSRWLWRQ